MTNTSLKRTNTEESFIELLKKNGLKATPQRLAVHRAMMSLGHASADQVSEWISANGGAHITVASVYNILTQLTLLGVYCHRLSANNKMFFDLNTFNHIHLYDCVNHEYKDVLDEDLLGLVEAKLLKSRRYRGYKLDRVDIQIVCHPSTKKTNTKKTCI